MDLATLGPVEFGRRPASGQATLFDESAVERETKPHEGKRPGEFAPKPKRPQTSGGQMLLMDSGVGDQPVERKPAQSAMPPEVAAPVQSAPLDGQKELFQAKFVPHPVHRDYPDEFETVHADAGKLDREWAKEPANYLPSNGRGQSEVDGRRDNFKAFLGAGNPIEQPHVVANDSGNLAFNDGRHRARVLMDLGHKTIPLSVPVEDAARIRTLVSAGNSPDAKSYHRSPAFKQWFGDWENEPHNASKVVHPETGEPQETGQIIGTGSTVTRGGKPITVYHGTGKGGWDRFDKSYLGRSTTMGGNTDDLLYGPGFYFTEDPGIAAGYAKIGSKDHYSTTASRHDLVALSKRTRAANERELELWKKAGMEQEAGHIKSANEHLKGIEALADIPKASFEDNQDVLRAIKNHAWSAESPSDPDQPIEKLGHEIIQKKDTGEVKKVHLNIRKPFDIDGKTPVGDMNGLRREFGDRLGNKIASAYGYTLNGDHGNWSVDNKIVHSAASELFGGKTGANEHLQKLGYDGITHIGGDVMGKGNHHRVWIAFEPNQIKSVENTGAFDPKDDRLNFSRDLESIGPVEFSVDPVHPFEKRYADAVNSSDYKTAQKHVDHAANLALTQHRNKWEQQGVSSFASAKDNSINLHEIRVPKEKQGQGLGTQYMKELQGFAGQHGMRVTLSPSTDFGASSKSRLTSFYRGLGFVPNSGRNKDFSTKETMLWRPTTYNPKAWSFDRDQSGQVVPLQQKFGVQIPRDAETNQFSRDWDESQHPRESEFHDDKHPGEFAPEGGNGHELDAENAARTERAQLAATGKPPETFASTGPLPKPYQFWEQAPLSEVLGDIPQRPAWLRKRDQVAKMPWTDAHESAQHAAAKYDVNIDDVVATMPAAHAHILDGMVERERAKADARKLTGVSARHEYADSDWSNIPRFDETSRSLAAMHPIIGIRPDDHYAPQKMWDFVREGKLKLPDINSRETADMAASMLAMARRTGPIHFQSYQDEQPDDEWTVVHHGDADDSELEDSGGFDPSQFSRDSLDDIEGIEKVADRMGVDPDSLLAAIAEMPGPEQESLIWIRKLMHDPSRGILRDRNGHVVGFLTRNGKQIQLRDANSHVTSTVTSSGHKSIFRSRSGHVQGSVGEFSRSPRFEPADVEHYVDTIRRNVTMRIPRQGETPENTWHSPEFTPRHEAQARRRFVRDNVHLADVPVGLLNHNPGEVAPERMARLESAGGSQDPIIVGIDGMNGNSNRKVLNVDDGNNRVHYAKQRGLTHVPAFLHGTPEEINSARQMIAQHSGPGPVEFARKPAAGQQSLTFEEPPQPTAAPAPEKQSTLPATVDFPETNTHPATKGVRVQHQPDGMTHFLAPENPWSLAKTPTHDAPRFLDEINGRLAHPANSGHATLDRVLSGQGKYLGKGHEAMVHDAGNGMVVKSAVITPFHINQGTRTREEANRIVSDTVDLSKNLRRRGIQGILPQYGVFHDGRMFAMQPKVDVEPKLTDEHIKQLEDTIHAVHNAGYVLRDQIQPGLDHNGRAALYDIGSAAKLEGKNPRWDEDDKQSDFSHLSYLASKHGLKYRTPRERSWDNNYDNLLFNVTSPKAGQEITDPKAANRMRAKLVTYERLMKTRDPDMHELYADHHAEAMAKLKAIEGQPVQMSRDPAAGQMSLWKEDEHPRAVDGKFADKLHHKIKEYLSDGTRRNLRDIHAHTGDIKTDAFDPTSNPTTAALKSLRDSGEISSQEPDYAEPMFHMTEEQKKKHADSVFEPVAKEDAPEAEEKSDEHKQLEEIHGRPVIKGKHHWMIRAKKGGEVSPVNGEPYIGGRFMPIHGLSEKKEPKKKVDKPVVPTEPPKPNPDSEGRKQRSPMSPEDIARLKQEREEQEEWSKLASSPLSHFLDISDKPHHKQQTAPVLDRWRRFAERIGPAAISELQSHLEKQRHAEIDSSVENAIQKQSTEEGQRRLASMGGRKITPADADWEKDQIKERATAWQSFEPRNYKAHEKIVPGSHYVRELLSDVLGGVDSEDSLPKRFKTVAEILAKHDSDARSKMADPQAARSAGYFPNKYDGTASNGKRVKAGDGWTKKNSQGKYETFTDDQVKTAMQEFSRDFGPVEFARHSFSSTQFNIEDAEHGRNRDPVAALMKLVKSIPTEHLHEGDRESPDSLHVTVKYGIHTEDEDEIRSIVEGFGPVAIKLGKVSVFPANEKKSFDVVKVTVFGEDIRRLNKLISESTECTDTYPDYKPHITLALLEPGYGKRYAGNDSVEGMELTFDTLQFSDKDRKKTEIDLTSSESEFSRDDDWIFAPLDDGPIEFARPIRPGAGQQSMGWSDDEQEHPVESSNIHSFRLENKGPGGANLLIRYLNKDKSGPGPEYRYFTGGRHLFDAMKQTVDQGKSAGQWTWRNLRVLGSKSGHHVAYELAGLGPDKYIPRQTVVGIRGKNGNPSIAGEHYVKRRFGGQESQLPQAPVRKAAGTPIKGYDINKLKLPGEATAATAQPASAPSPAKPPAPSTAPAKTPTATTPPAANPPSPPTAPAPKKPGLIDRVLGFFKRKPKKPPQEFSRQEWEAVEAILELEPGSILAN